MRLRNGPWVIWLAPGIEPAPILATLGSIERRSGETTLPANRQLWEIHSGGRSTIYGVRLPKEQLCLKVFHDRRPLTLIRNFFGRSKGRRAFRNGQLAFDRGVPVPHVYAYAERRPCGPNLVVMELLDQSVQMNLLLEARLDSGVDLVSDPAFHHLARQFARFTRDLHARGVCHRDFSPRNVLVVDPDEQTKLQLIDLEDIDLAGSTRKFRSDIEHFHGKMARYVDPAALHRFRCSFDEVYGGGQSR